MVTTDTASFSARAIPGIPMIGEGDDIAQIIGDALDASDLRPEPGDIIVVTHKIVSKAEGRVLDLGELDASAPAHDLASATGKDPAFVEAILSEASGIIRHRHGVIIAEHRLGMVMANAGIDRSNVPGRRDRVLLLPKDPDGSSAAIRASLGRRFGTAPAVIICDSAGRAWRNGVVGVAIGAAGLPALLDLRGRPDLEGRPLDVTEVGLADEIASAAQLLMGEADEARPVVLIRGLCWDAPARPAADLIRSRNEDLFR